MTADKQRDRQRGSAAKRGYDRDWWRFRAWFLHRWPICMDCKREPSKEVHHKVKLRDRPDLRLHESNCMGLCKPCHSIRTLKGE